MTWIIKEHRWLDERTADLDFLKSLVRIYRSGGLKKLMFNKYRLLIRRRKGKRREQTHT